MAGRRDVEFRTQDGLKLKGWFYSAGEKQPCIIMSNGLSGSREQFLPDFAQRFQEAGYGVLVYDERNWGASEGEPRNHTDPLLQVRDYSSAYDFVASVPEVDPAKVVFWGSSMAGGNAILAAAVDVRAAGVIAQVPFVSGEKLVAAGLGLKTQLLLSDHASISSGNKPAMVPVVPLSKEEAESGTSQAILTGKDVWPFVEEMTRRGLCYEKFCTAQTLFCLQRHEPISFIHRVAPRPVLMVIGEKDTDCQTSWQLEMFSKAREPKQLHILKEQGHFGVYYGPPFEENSKVQINFLQRLFA